MGPARPGTGRLTEPDVVITDLLLAAQSGGFAWFFRRSRETWLGSGALVMFAGLALAALAGAAWHGFLTQPSALSWWTWWLTMVFAGLAALGYSLVGLRLLGRHSRAAVPVLVAVAGGYGVASALWPDFILTAAVALAGTALFLAGAWRQRRATGVRLAAAGALLAVLALLPQQLQLGIPRAGLSHNAVYHVILLAAHYLLYRGLRLLAPGPNSDRRRTRRLS